MLGRVIQGGTFFVIVFHWATVGMADTIYLKNGQKIEGDVVERKQDSITIKLEEGGSVPYWLDEIERIEVGESPLPNFSSPAQGEISPPLRGADADSTTAPSTTNKSSEQQEVLEYLHKSGALIKAINAEIASHNQGYWQTPWFVEIKQKLINFKKG